MPTSTTRQSAVTPSALVRKRVATGEARFRFAANIGQQKFMATLSQVIRLEANGVTCTPVKRQPNLFRWRYAGREFEADVYQISGEKVHITVCELPIKSAASAEPASKASSRRKSA